ncbi:MAG: Flp pilus assembly complex ATPase component TadA, partial [Bacteriovoracaceae bacterium]|nr:Flp pilus assembly complex ATPase component TadA [Bacteriovoracaceae bacterium]
MAGHVIAVIGGKGGVGKSQFAANLAYGFSRESRAKVLLLDFDQKASGDQNIITGLKPKKNLKDLSEFSGAIDPRSLQPFLAGNPQNVSFVGLPNDPTATQTINVEGLGKTLKAVTNIFPLTVIDCGSDLNEMALKALEYSTLIFMVTVPDILAVNQTKRLYQDLVTMLFPKDMIQLVLNQHQKGHPVTPDIVGRQVGKPVFAVIPKDDQSCVASLNKGKALMTILPTSPFAKGVLECARKLIQKNVLKTLEKLNKPADAGKRPSSNNGDTKNGGSKNIWTDLKSRIHKGLVEEMDMKNAADDSDPKAMIILKEQTRKLVVELLGKEDTKAVLKSREDMNQIVKEIIDEALGLGPLEDLLSDPKCTEIMVCGPSKIYYEYAGKLKLSDVIFTNDRQVLNVIERIVAPIGRRIDEKTPYVDARLRDGSRVHAVIPPCSIDGCTITIRKFPEERLTY